LSRAFEGEEISEQVGSVLKETIDGSMRDLLGEEARKAVVFHLQVPDYERHPKEFHVHLGGIFKLGAPVIEKMIVRDVYKQFNLSFDEDRSFDYEQSMHLAVKAASKRQAELKGGR
jgi:hypothetical protein